MISLKWAEVIVTLLLNSIRPHFLFNDLICERDENKKHWIFGIVVIQSTAEIWDCEIKLACAGTCAQCELFRASISVHNITNW